MIGTLADDGWAVTFGTARMGLGGLRPRPGPSSLHKMQQPTGRATALPRPLLAVPNITAHPSMANVPTSCYLMWHYNCLWILEGLTSWPKKRALVHGPT